MLWNKMVLVAVVRNGYVLDMCILLLLSCSVMSNSFMTPQTVAHLCPWDCSGKIKLASLCLLQHRICRRWGLIPGLETPPGGRHGNLLWYSCLENPMDRGAWHFYGPWGRRVSHNWSNWAHMHVCVCLCVCVCDSQWEGMRRTHMHLKQ